MRHLYASLCLSALLTSCVTAPGDAASTTPADLQAKVTVTSTGRSKLMPANATSPGFGNLKVDLMTLDALVDPNAVVTPGGPASLGQIAMQSASPQCEVIGCPWNMTDVQIKSTNRGLVSVVTDGHSTPVWHTTYALVVNGNQVLDNVKLASPIRSFAPAYVLAEAAVTKLAQLVGTDAATLVQRGVCLGLVWSGRGEGTGIAPGFAGAAVQLGATGGTLPDLYYLNDALDAISTTGTNQDGLFVLVGPDLSQKSAVAPTTYGVPITVDRATSAGVFDNNVAIVRPGIVTVVPIIPRR
jgi:hypothetical protein